MHECGTLPGMYRNLAVPATGGLLLLAAFVITFNGEARSRADFVWNNMAEPQTLDPRRMSGQTEGDLSTALFEGLTVYHPRTLEPLPGVAQRWEIDGMTYRFHLRRDAWWIQQGEIHRRSDGPHNVTAHDFVATWRSHAYPETGSNYAYLFDLIEGYETFRARMESHWQQLVQRHAQYGKNIVRPADLAPRERQAVRDYRVAEWKKNVRMRATDDYTLEITLRSVAPYFTALTSFYAFAPVPMRVIEEHGARWIAPENIVTNGPYSLESWRFNAFIRLRKNRHYWENQAFVEQRVAELSENTEDEAQERELKLLRELGSFELRGLDSLEAVAVEEQNTSLNLYLNGDVDRVRELPTTVVGDLIEASRSSAGLPHLHHAPQAVVYFYNLNLELPIFQGMRGWKLRRAMALAIDREGLIRSVTREYQAPAYGLVPPGVPDYSSRRLLGSGDRKEDLETARALMAEVMGDFPNGLPTLKVLYNTSENHAKVAAFIQAGWRRELGLEVELTNQEWGVFLDSRKTGNFDIARMGWIGDYPDAATFLELYTTGNPNNDCRYSNPFFDRLMEEYVTRISTVLSSAESRARLVADLNTEPLFRRRESEAALDPERYSMAALLERHTTATDASQRLEAEFAARRWLLELAEEILARDLPVIPIYFYTRAQLWPPELEGCSTNLLDTHPQKFLRWRRDRRPQENRYEAFPGLERASIHSSRANKPSGLKSVGGPPSSTAAPQDSPPAPERSGTGAVRGVTNVLRRRAELAPSDQSHSERKCCHDEGDKPPGTQCGDFHRSELCQLEAVQNEELLVHGDGVNTVGERSKTKDHVVGSRSHKARHESRRQVFRIGVGVTLKRARRRVGIGITAVSTVRRLQVNRCAKRCAAVRGDFHLEVGPHVFSIVVVGEPAVVSRRQVTQSHGQVGWSRRLGAIPVAVAAVACPRVRTDPVGQEIEVVADPVGIECGAAVDGLSDSRVRRVGPVGGYGNRCSTTRKIDVVRHWDEICGDFVSCVIRLVPSLGVRPAVLSGRVEVDQQLRRRSLRAEKHQHCHHRYKSAHHFSPVCTRLSNPETQESNPTIKRRDQERASAEDVRRTS